jgi:thymidylate synthase
MEFHNERGYIRLLRHVMDNGVMVPNRTGIPCKAIFDAKLVYDTDKFFPFSTIRPASTKFAFEEFWFFLNGKTQTKELEDKGIYFWHDNTTREFLDSRGLTELDVGDMGAAYGSQFRGYGKTTISSDFVAKDQLLDTYNTLLNDPYSRRIYNTFWNPNESHLMALTPCHHSHQFVVLPDSDGNMCLNLKLINRSLDVVFGLSFAVQNYALYQVAMAKLLGMKVGKLSIDLSHVHVYENQFDYANEILTRDFGKNGTIHIDKDIKSIEDLLSLQWEDFVIEGLEVNKSPFKTPRPPMAA